MAFAALDCSAGGVADFYGALLDGSSPTRRRASVRALQVETRMSDATSRARVARQTLDFALALA